MSIKFNKPLIGIEWEPQVSLQNYPNNPVSLVWRNCQAIKVLQQKDHILQKDQVVLSIPNSLEKAFDIKNMYIDVNNMEIYTDPVDIKHLSAEIAKRDKLLKEFWVLVASHINQMIGVFLPASNKEPFVTKHVNISYSVKSEVAKRLIKGYYAGRQHNKQRQNPYMPQTLIKYVDDSYHNQRVHITVPYNFQHYEALYKSYLEVYHRALLRDVFIKGHNIYADSMTRAYVDNKDNRIETWFKTLKGWLLEYSQDNPMNDPILLGIATPTRFREKHKLI
jgi:hypothetical protein